MKAEEFARANVGRDVSYVDPQKRTTSGHGYVMRVVGYTDAYVVGYTDAYVVVDRAAWQPYPSDWMKPYKVVEILSKIVLLLKPRNGTVLLIPSDRLCFFFPGPPVDRRGPAARKTIPDFPHLCACGSKALQTAFSVECQARCKRPAIAPARPVLLGQWGEEW